MIRDTMEAGLLAYVVENRDRLFGLIGDLVRLNSQNMPPTGRETPCQRYIAAKLHEAGWQPDLYSLSTLKGLAEHPLFTPGRDYAGRANLGARREGSGGGRSLVLSGHVDTVPRGTQPWTRNAFGGEIEGGRLYGRGAADMKAGVAINLFVAEAVSRLGLRLRGDLVFESVIDEEFGGVNGTLAGRLRGYNADAAIVSEPSSLRICPAQRGGRTAHIRFSAPGGVLSEEGFPRGVIDQLTRFLGEVPRFAEGRRKRVKVHPLYAHHVDPVPVSITKIFTSPWGTEEPITIPEECRVEFYWQLMPGEGQEEVEGEFFEWLDGVVSGAREIFPRRPEVEFPIRWLPGSAIAAEAPLVKELAEAATAVLGGPPAVVGIEGPCDLFLFHEWGIPAVLWGPSGGNVHGADEYVELDSAVKAAQALLLLVVRWCGLER